MPEPISATPQKYVQKRIGPNHFGIIAATKSVTRKWLQPNKIIKAAKKILPAGISFCSNNSKELELLSENEPAITKAPPQHANASKGSIHDIQLDIFSGLTISVYGNWQVIIRISMQNPK